MTRARTEAKAARYLASGNLTVTRVDSDGTYVTAICTGQDGAEYQLGYDPRRPEGWWCDCPARRMCAHLIALQTVTVRRRPA